MSKSWFEKIPSLSDFPSRKEWEATLWEKFIESPELLRLCTPAYERHHMVMRIAAIEGLMVGKSYRKIAEELWLSPQTISAIKKSFDEKTYKSYLERSKKERKKRIYHSSRPNKRKRAGTPRKTKYGTLYMP